MTKFLCEGTFGSLLDAKVPWESVGGVIAFPTLICLRTCLWYLTGLVFLALTVRTLGRMLPSFSGRAGKGEAWAGIRVSPAHWHRPLSSAAQHVWEPALHYHGPHDRLLRLFCHHVPRDQGLELLEGTVRSLCFLFCLDLRIGWGWVCM